MNSRDADNRSDNRASGPNTNVTSGVADAVSDLERKIWYSAYIRSLIETAEPEIFSEPNRFRAFLMDQFPTGRREIRALHLAAEENVAEALRRAAANDAALDVEARRQRTKLENDLGLAPALAAWTVDVLVLAVRTTSIAHNRGAASAAKTTVTDRDKTDAGGPKVSKASDRSIKPAAATKPTAVPPALAASPPPLASEAASNLAKPPPLPRDLAASPPAPAFATASDSSRPPAAPAAAASVPASAAPAAVTPRSNNKLPMYIAGAAGAAAVIGLIILAQVKSNPPPPPPQPPRQTSTLEVPNGSYLGKRVWTDYAPGAGDLCHFFHFTVSVSNGAISFTETGSNGHTWRGTINQGNGFLDIHAVDQPQLFIHGRYSYATMESFGKCRAGYFELIK